MNDIKQAFLEMPEVKRIKELESYVDNNFKLNQIINDLKEKQKQMVHAKEFNQFKQYEVYKNEYDALYEQILDFPFVEEYLELLEVVNQELLELSNIIQNKINNQLNRKEEN